MEQAKTGHERATEMPKILVLDNLSGEGVDVFRDAEGFDVDVKPPQKTDELAAIIGDQRLPGHGSRKIRDLG